MEEKERDDFPFHWDNTQENSEILTRPKRRRRTQDEFGKVTSITPLALVVASLILVEWTKGQLRCS
jgi:hypothetical protein